MSDEKNAVEQHGTNTRKFTASVSEFLSSGLGIAIVGALIAMTGTWFITKYQVTSAFQQQQEVFRQTFAQLEKQQSYALELQNRQHEQSIKQLEIQGGLARDQIKFQSDLANSAEATRIRKANHDECIEDRRRIQQLRASAHEKLFSVEASFFAAYDLRDLYSAASSLVSVVAEKSPLRTDKSPPLSKDDWLLYKDIGSLIVSARERESAFLSAEVSLRATIVEASLVFPKRGMFLFTDMESKIPASTNFVAQMKEALAEWDGEGFASASMVEKARKMFERDREETMKDAMIYAEASRATRKFIVDTLVNPPESCR